MLARKAGGAATTMLDEVVDRLGVQTIVTGYRSAGHGVQPLRINAAVAEKRFAGIGVDE